MPQTTMVKRTGTPYFWKVCLQCVLVLTTRLTKACDMKSLSIQCDAKRQRRGASCPDFEVRFLCIKSCKLILSLILSVHNVSLKTNLLSLTSPCHMIFVRPLVTTFAYERLSISSWFSISIVPMCKSKKIGTPHKMNKKITLISTLYVSI